MFEKSILKPIADSGKCGQRQKTGSQLLVSGGDGTSLLEALEEVLDLVAVSVVPPVMRSGAEPVGFRRDAGAQSAAGEKLAEGVAVVRLVSEDRAVCDSRDERRSCGEIVRITRREPELHRSTPGVDQRVDLGVGAASGCSNALTASASSRPSGVLVGFRTGRVDRPKPAVRPGRQTAENDIPQAGLAPLLPARVDRGMGSEDPESSPRAALAKAVENGQENRLGRQRRTSARYSWFCVRSFLRDEINFFSTAADAASL